MASSKTVEKEIDFKAASTKLIQFCQISKSINEMMELLGWKDRTKFRKRFINPLINQGKLAMTIPDKTKSSNQRYVSTEK